jgi:hypothetical protein
MEFQIGICHFPIPEGAVARFIGRQLELTRLAETTAKPSASFIVVRGRRRVGKSRLIDEFARRFDHYYVFTGLAPDSHTGAEHQLREFSRQMASQFATARAVYEDWGDALWAVRNAFGQARFCCSSTRSRGWGREIRPSWRRSRMSGTASSSGTTISCLSSVARPPPG